MKKINSIDYGGKFIGIGAVFLIALPAVLSFLMNGPHAAVLRVIRLAFITIGGMIEIGFFVLLGIELHQDRIIAEYYEKNPASLKTPQQILDERRRRII